MSQMSKYAHSDVLDGGPKVIKDNAIRMVLLKAYTPGDDFAAVASNAISSVVMASADFVLSGADMADRLLTTAPKSGTASAGSGATPDLHVAFTDNVSRVLWVTDETTDQVVTSGNPVNFPAAVYTSKQPI